MPTRSLLKTQKQQRGSGVFANFSRSYDHHHHNPKSIIEGRKVESNKHSNNESFPYLYLGSQWKFSELPFKERQPKLQPKFFTSVIVILKTPVVAVLISYEHNKSVKIFKISAKWKLNCDIWPVFGSKYAKFTPIQTIFSGTKFWWVIDIEATIFLKLNRQSVFHINCSSVIWPGKIFSGAKNLHAPRSIENLRDPSFFSVWLLQDRNKFSKDHQSWSFRLLCF